MTRHAPALAATLLLATSACGGPLFDAEVKNIRVTLPDVELAAVPGIPVLGEIEFDIGVELPNEDGWVTTLELKALRVAWLDPENHPDFSHFTSARLTAVPGPESALPPVVVASYVQDPDDPDPDEIVIAGDPGVNLASYLAEEILTLRIEAEGSLPAYAWTSSARIVADMSFRTEFTP